MKIQKYIAVIFSALMLSACGESSEPAASEEAISEASISEMTEAAEETSSESEMTTTEEAVETTAQTTEQTSITEESTSAVTESESVSEAAAVPVSDRPFGIYEIEVKDGAPEICDLDAIKARRRTDMAEHYMTDPENSNDVDRNFDEYSDPAEYIEQYFGYSFDDSSPVTSYIEDDFDFDGMQEYYLCMAEYVVTPFPEPPNTYDGGIVISVYYIDDDGTVMNTFSRLSELCFPEILSGDSAEEALEYVLMPFADENNLKFQIERGYSDFEAPLAIDYGDSKHILWKNGDDYPSDNGGYILWGDKSIRVEISAPSASLGGFYEWGSAPEDLFVAEREKFGDDFWATEVNLATKLDLYTYPEINGKVNTIKWDGQNYVYNIIEKTYFFTPDSGPVEWK